MGRKVMGYTKFASLLAIATLVVGVLLVNRVNAAGSGSLYISPSNLTAKAGDTITLDYRENSGAAPVNAVSITSNYNTAFLQFLAVDFNNSAFEITAQSNGANGIVNIDRGTTNQNLTGDQEVAKVIFKVVAKGSTTVTIAGASVVLQDSGNTDQVGTRSGTSLTLQSGFENRVAHVLSGKAYYFTGNNRYYIPNPAVRNCVMVRDNTGPDFLTSDAEVNAFTDNGTPAHCPYEKEPGLNFIKESSSPTIWLVHADGTKQHVGSLCVVDPFTTVLKKFHVFIVPDGETAGHIQTSDWFASGAACAALPG